MIINISWKYISKLYEFMDATTPSFGIFSKPETKVARGPNKTKQKYFFNIIIYDKSSNIIENWKIEFIKFESISYGSARHISDH